MSETHEMTLTGTAESGAEEWACPTCGRRIIFRWPPSYEKLVLEYGDANAVHVGGKGGLRMGGLAVAPSAAETSAEMPTEMPDEMPADERDWLNENGIEWDGTSG